MAIHINLLHEKVAEKQQRERDPLKLSLLVGIAILGLLGGLHVLSTGEFSKLQREASSLRSELTKLKPQAAEAAKEEQRLQSLVRGSQALTNRAERRMLWGTALETLANAVPREVQISSLAGGLAPGRDTVEILLDGVAAGSEPRTVAEDFRLALRTKFGEIHPGTDARFRVLEDSPATANLDGQSWPCARFVILVSFPHPRTRTN